MKLPYLSRILKEIIGWFSNDITQKNVHEQYVPKSALLFYNPKVFLTKFYFEYSIFSYLHVSCTIDGEPLVK